MLNFINLMAAMMLAENQQAVQTIQAVDSQGGTVTYGISGGADAPKFAINATTGELAFIDPPDHDVPGDANADNVYEVEVTASSTSSSPGITQALTITISQATDALEKSLDLARVSAEKIADEAERNDEQDARMDDLDEAVGTKADQSAVDTLSQTVGTKASQDSVDTLTQTVGTKASQADLNAASENISLNANEVAALKQLFDGNVIKLSSVPEQLRQGMKPMGTFHVGTDALPAATVSNEFQYYIVNTYGQVDFSAAQDGSDMRDVSPKDWIISTGTTGWDLIEGGDGLTTVNGKTAQNGSVTIAAGDTPFNPDAGAGITATNTEDAVKEVGTKTKALEAAIGNASAYDPVAEFNRAYNKRRAQG